MASIVRVRDYQDDCNRMDAASGITSNPHHLQLIEEVGELCGKYKRAVRDCGGKVTPELRSAMIAEAGDVLWSVTMLGRRHGIRLDAVVGGDYFVMIEPERGRTIDPDHELRLLGLTAAQVASGFLPVEVVTLRRVLEHLARFCAWIDTTLEYAAVANLEKLADRLARNVIRGEGDKR